MKKYILKEYSYNILERDISDVFVQLAYFKKELTEDYSNVVTTIKNTYNYSDVADIYRRDFEKTPDDPESRREYAGIIYEQIKEM